MKYCGQCGNQLKNVEVHFCPNCGHQLPISKNTQSSATNNSKMSLSEAQSVIDTANTLTDYYNDRARQINDTNQIALLFREKHELQVAYNKSIAGSVVRGAVSVLSFFSGGGRAGIFYKGGTGEYREKIQERINEIDNELQGFRNAGYSNLVDDVEVSLRIRGII